MNRALCERQPHVQNHGTGSKLNAVIGARLPRPRPSPLPVTFLTPQRPCDTLREPVRGRRHVFSCPTAFTNIFDWFCASNPSCSLGEREVTCLLQAEKCSSHLPRFPISTGSMHIDDLYWLSEGYLLIPGLIWPARASRDEAFWEAPRQLRHG